MKSIILAAAMVVGFAAHAGDHGHAKTGTTPPAHAPGAPGSVPVAPTAPGAAAAATKMTKELAEKECKNEKATDLKTCVASKLTKPM